MKNSIQCVDKMGGKSTGEGQIALYIGVKGVLLVELCTFTNRFVQGWMYIFDKPMLWLMKNSTQCVDKTVGKSTGDGRIV